VTLVEVAHAVEGAVVRRVRRDVVLQLPGHEVVRVQSERRWIVAILVMHDLRKRVVGPVHRTTERPLLV